jgi:alpha-L-rhamnosidase
MSAKSVRMGWAVDIPIVVDLLVRYYGDTQAVPAVYPTLKRFLEICGKEFSPEDTPKCIGDHEAIDKADQQTTAMCHYHQFLKLTAKFARRLGLEDDAARYEATASRLEGVFAERARYVPAKGFVGNGRQGEEAFAIYHRMLPPADLDAAYKLLRYDVVAHGNALSTGIFGTQYLLDILTERGDADLAGKVVLHEGFPGWLNMLDHGATTLWESWIGSEDIYSHCHPMFGSVAGWMMKCILGIRVCDDAVGCDKIILDPCAVAGVKSASGWFDTPKGRVEVSWRMVDGRLSVERRVPDGIAVAEK